MNRCTLHQGVFPCFIGTPAIEHFLTTATTCFLGIATGGVEETEAHSVPGSRNGSTDENDITRAHGKLAHIPETKWLHFHGHKDRDARDYFTLTTLGATALAGPSCGTASASASKKKRVLAWLVALGNELRPLCITTTAISRAVLGWLPAGHSF